MQTAIEFHGLLEGVHGAAPSLRTPARQRHGQYEVVVVGLSPVFVGVVDHRARYKPTGFAVPALYDYCEEEGITHTVGLVSNPHLEEMA